MSIDNVADRNNSKRIIVCADDFGLTEAASQSIVALVACGAISATSGVVDGPFTEKYSRALLSAGEFSLGLHLNLTENPSAKLNANLRTWLLNGFVLRSIERAPLKSEITRQLDKFEALFKRAPAYVDGHEHVHQFPGVRDALLEILPVRYGKDIAIRSTVPKSERGLKAFIIASLGGRAMRKRLLSAGIRTNADFAGVYDFSTHIAFDTRMRRWLQSIADGGMIMCHPEVPGSALPHSAREMEHEFLSSPRWQQLRQAYGVQLVPCDTAIKGDQGLSVHAR